MRILLLGEYSNLHYTLACALRDMGHEVRLVSDGDEWKRYPTDVRLSRRSNRPFDTLIYLLRLAREVRHWKGYDAVQLINPVHFVQLKAERGIRLYDWIRRHNKRVFLGAFGDDYYFIHNSYVRRPLRYSDFYTPSHEVDHAWNRQNREGWLENEGMVNSCKHIAQTCDGIIAALYEYYVTYKAVPDLASKTTFIPLPIDYHHPDHFKGNHALQPTYFSASSQEEHAPASQGDEKHKIRLFIGIQRQRSALKGTDILMKVAQELQKKDPDRVELVTAENLPYAEYVRQLEGCDILLDQIYSYTPAMNALQAMSRGIVVLSGGEEEQYELLGEQELRPIINTLPEEDDIHAKLEEIIHHPERLHELRRQGFLYIERHHDSRKIAAQYVDFWCKT